MCGSAKSMHTFLVSCIIVYIRYNTSFFKDLLEMCVQTASILDTTLVGTAVKFVNLLAIHFYIHTIAYKL